MNTQQRTLIVKSDDNWVCDDNWSFTLLAQHPRSLQPKGDPPIPRGTYLGNSGETRSGVGKNGVLENKSGNISETRKGGGKVTIEGL